MSSMTRATLLLVAWIAFGSGSAPLSAQSTTGDPPSPGEEPSSFDTLFDQSDLGNVAQTARTHFNSGLRELNRGEKLLEKAGSTSNPEKAEKLKGKASDALSAAASEFTEAIGFAPDLHEAYASLGRALRLLGQYPNALKVHSVALNKFPNDEENFKGWSETIVGLSMLGDATRAYSQYLESHPERSAQLMALLEDWLEEKRADPETLEAEDIDRLATWIKAQQGASG